MKRAAAILGIGTEHVYEVDPDESGRVSAEKMEEKILYCHELGFSVFFVGITAGTTVFGAFDPIEDIAVVCRKYNIWLHVDGAWGGSALLSPKTKHLLQGIDKADSFTWNPHKLMSVHLQCSAILIRHSNILMQANQMLAGYLFQPDKHYETSLDTGDKTIQCGRHIDIFKLWLGWKARGHQGYAEHVETLLKKANFFYEIISKREPFFRMVMKPPFINVCFWYVPPSLQNIDQTSLEYKERLDKIAPRIKERMMTNGTMMVGYQRLDHHPNFFRAIISNPATTIQCGRHIDIFKLWLGWKARGHQGYAEHVETLLKKANFFYEIISKREPFFRMVMKPPFINVCFWYIPPSLQNIDQTSLEYKERLDKIAPRIKERMMTNGTMMVGYQRLDHHPNFFRAIISNPATTKDDIIAMIDEIHELGHDL
ncbi:unnamed protein product [Rotaria sp. Silwood1]|nr:unnamed protein product [Rotaria sp. Silwood1]